MRSKKSKSTRTGDGDSVSDGEVDNGEDLSKAAARFPKVRYDSVSEGDGFDPEKKLEVEDD